MKHEVTSLNTKKTLAASLKRLMEKKPFSKITVSEIINDCGVNRKTFYYHFEDIYALMKWMFEQEAIEVVKNFDLIVDYEEAISFVIDYVDANKHILNCAYDSIGREGMKRFLHADFMGIAQMVMNSAERSLELCIDEDFKIFLCKFYSDALSGVMIDWFQDKTVRSREEIIQYISLICRESLPAILMKRSQEKDGIM